MRVGANVRQFAKIKKMHAEGVPAPIIAKTIQMTEQSLEKILANLEGRDEVTLALKDSPELNAMRLENAELAARLAKYENPEDSGEGANSGDETEEDKGED